MLSGVSPDLLAFCEPWLAREPRLQLACQFASEGAARERFLATQVLLRELAQTVFAVSEERVAQARLSWWSDEASYWLQGHPRHPLALGFDAMDAAPTVARLSYQMHGWLERSPDSIDALGQQLEMIATQAAQLAGAAAGGGWSTIWLALAMRQSLGAQAGLASLLPLDLCARHGLRRSQWAELAPMRRCALLLEVSAGLNLTAAAAVPDAAALAVLEQRWLRRLARGTEQRLGVLDVFSAWRAARRSR